MNLDTVNKRSSAIGIALPFLRIRPRPGTSITGGYRRQIAFCYAGFNNGSSETASNTLTISQSATATREHSESLSQSLTITQSATKTFLLSFSLTNTLTISQTLVRAWTHLESVSNSLVVSQTVARQWEHSESLSQSLTLTESGSTGGATVSCSSTLNVDHSCFYDRIAVDALYKTIQFLSTDKTVVGGELTRGIHIKADKDNSGILYVGLDDVNSAHSYWLYPDQEKFFSVCPSNRLFVLAEVDNDKASIAAVEYIHQPILGP